MNFKFHPPPNIRKDKGEDMEEIRNNTQLLQTARDCLTSIRAQVSKKVDIEKTWIWDANEIKALDVVLAAIHDCL